jgi:hypothetical protein
LGVFEIMNLRRLTVAVTTAQKILTCPAAMSIELAERHIPNCIYMRSSAELCLKDAKALYTRGELTYSQQRAARSLAYSVGTDHSDYKLAVSAV